MKKNHYILNFLRFYNILWQAALPFLRYNKRLAPTFDRRTGTDHLPPADIWIQAASAGESFLALSILRQMAPACRVTVLLTSTTDQGLAILKQGLAEPPLHPHIRTVLEVFPFDMPQTVNLAVRRVNPCVMVLLETELWPALLYALKKNQTRILVLNARMSAKSMRNYGLTKKLWRPLAPDLVLATSARDTARYAQVFPHTPSAAMDNIKFDIMETPEQPPSAMDRLLPGDMPLSILASVRRQEEPELLRMILRLKDHYPDQVIAVFPRHMHRIAPLFKQMKKQGLAPVLGSKLTAPLTGPGIILWDRFGELRAAYGRASSVFVGGSLRPLGGQNFLEPAVLGVPTVIGPHWEDFAWVGEDIFKTGGVTRCKNWAVVAETMADQLKSPPDRTLLKQKTSAYIRTRRGGSKNACRAIASALAAKRGAPL
ncbi:MAG: 3-deoxy-D-manno-octulosonic acid transferase [Desulfobacter sp.]|nr:MAG: 3-deoxy-D-manno-octulosonic acid transferase [Desulfobacter sp.]